MSNTSYKYRYFSRSILLQMFIVLVLLLIVIFWQRDFLLNIYVRNQMTSLGWVINGAIVVLFIIGMIRVVNLFAYYGREEEATARFEHNLRQNIEPIHGIAAPRLICERYSILQNLRAQNASINHSALAATMVAGQTSQLSFPKFVNNVLILTGVFGTIVSLSITLLGTSNIISNSSDVGNLSLVIHGMSTALSTTMTAILCYLLFSYFFLRLLDSQTNLVSHIEHITATQLLARFQTESENTMGEFSHIVRATSALLKRLEQLEESNIEIANFMKRLVEEFHQEIQSSNHKTNEVIGLLKEGFRLKGDDKS